MYADNKNHKLGQTTTSLIYNDGHKQWRPQQWRDTRIPTQTFVCSRHWWFAVVVIDHRVAVIVCGRHCHSTVEPLTTVDCCTCEWAWIVPSHDCWCRRHGRPALGLCPDIRKSPPRAAEWTGCSTKNTQEAQLQQRNSASTIRISF